MCIEMGAAEGGPGWAAVAVLLDRDRVLLIKRAERRGDPWSGQVALPGGRWAPGDVDLYATAVRETREEVGLEPLEPLGHLSPEAPSNAPWLRVLPVVYTKWRGVLSLNVAEVQEARWVPLRELEEAGGAYRWGGWTIWGLTYRVLKKLLFCLPPTQ
ncbi:MAG: CoA pyrophosphatase [Pyrobaculum sp.]